MKPTIDGSITVGDEQEVNLDLDDLDGYIGESVDVNSEIGDDFNDFTGTVIGIKDGLLKVRDQEDDVWLVNPRQVEMI